jgi:hypothetical protein
VAILEYAAISEVLDLVLVLIGIATAGYALKVKLLDAAIKAAKQVDAKLDKESERIDKHDFRLNSCESDISALKERTRHL